MLHMMIVYGLKLQALPPPQQSYTCTHFMFTFTSFGDFCDCSRPTCRPPLSTLVDMIKTAPLRCQYVKQ